MQILINGQYLETCVNSHSLIVNPLSVRHKLSATNSISRHVEMLGDVPTLLMRPGCQVCNDIRPVPPTLPSVPRPHFPAESGNKTPGAGHFLMGPVSRCHHWPGHIIIIKCISFIPLQTLHCTLHTANCSFSDLQTVNNKT